MSTFTSTLNGTPVLLATDADGAWTVWDNSDDWRPVAMTWQGQTHPDVFAHVVRSLFGAAAWLTVQDCHPCCGVSARDWCAC